jgi:hypothetical protein
MESEKLTGGAENSPAFFETWGIGTAIIFLTRGVEKL